MLFQFIDKDGPRRLVTGKVGSSALRAGIKKESRDESGRTNSACVAPHGGGLSQLDGGRLQTQLSPYSWNVIRLVC